LDIKQIKQNTNIVRIIGQYVNLQEKGNKAVGLCPFHNDHHPSLTVDSRRQTYTCYACGAHGDVFTFIQQIENIGFTEAALLIENGKVKIENEKKLPKSKPNFQLSTSNFQLKNEEYLRSLMPYIPAHSELTDTYLAFEVGLSPVMVPPAFKHFSGRIIFPIRNDEGLLVGFAGRMQPPSPLKGGLVESPQNPPFSRLGGGKYINSSLADGFRKGDVLYGLYKAKETIVCSGEVYLTEGYKDTLAMHAAGFVNTVALCGTALTEGHIALLKKYGVEKVFLFLDNDRAGEEAMHKIAGRLSREGIDSLRIAAEAGHDPDSLFCEKDAVGFAGYIKEASHPPVLLRDGNPYDNEIALQTAISDLVRHYRRTHDTQLRQDILHTLYHRLDQYSILSQELGRTGAV